MPKLPIDYSRTLIYEIEHIEMKVQYMQDIQRIGINGKENTNIVLTIKKVKNIIENYIK